MAFTIKTLNPNEVAEITRLNVTVDAGFKVLQIIPQNGSDSLDIYMSRYEAQDLITLLQEILDQDV